MSRYGSIPILVPKGVEVNFQDGKVAVKGPKGTLTLELPKGLLFRFETNEIVLEKQEGEELVSAMHGLYRSLVNNMVIGVSKGFEKTLNLVGVGYRANLVGHHIDLQIGFSHPIKIEIPKSVKVNIDKNVTISISGIDKQVVGQFAATIRAVRPPEPYKGKGIRYENERVRKKAGKAAKAKTAA